MNVPVCERGAVKREGEGGPMWWMCFVIMYENRTVKLVEIVLRMEVGAIRENVEGVKLIQVCCKHTGKCHNESP
jgi:hypothetical protein